MLLHPALQGVWGSELRSLGLQDKRITRGAIFPSLSVPLSLSFLILLSFESSECPLVSRSSGLEERELTQNRQTISRGYMLSRENTSVWILFFVMDCTCVFVK